MPTARRKNDTLADSAARPTFHDWLERSRLVVEEAIAGHLRELEITMGPHSRLPAAVQYSVKLGGKRVRPILVLETCRICGGRPETALPAALAMEFVHTFSLIHDDLPAMDNDDLRRGQPTNHKVFGEGQAVLAGDWLVTHAFSMLASDRYDQSIVVALLETLADGTERMIEGQGADLEGEDLPPNAALVQYIHAHKTAALLETCCRMGAICAAANGESVAALARYGHHLGLAFQIIDDLLDASGSTAALGKRAGKDAEASKQTYPAAFGLDAARTRAGAAAAAATRELDLFDHEADHLRALAQYVVSRDR
jgi:geranylgeranyl diphosphate synthase, type II